MHPWFRRAVSCSAALVALLAGGCAQLPTEPAGGGAGLPRGDAPLGGIPLVSDSTADVPVLAALGGVAVVNGYLVTVPAGALDRDATMHLRVTGPQALNLTFTPANVGLNKPLVVSASLRAVSADLMGNYALYSISGNTWTRLPGSLCVPAEQLVKANVPGPGTYALGNYVALWPNAAVLQTAAELDPAIGGPVACGPVRVDVPAGALRDVGVVDMRWTRANNVVSLEITPAELNGFETPVMLTMSASSLPEDVRADAVICWWNPATGKWEVVAGSVVDPVTGNVRAPLRHFSQYTVGLQSKAGWGPLPTGRPLTE